MLISLPQRPYLCSIFSVSVSPRLSGRWAFGLINHCKNEFVLGDRRPHMNFHDTVKTIETAVVARFVIHIRMQGGVNFVAFCG